MENRFVSSFGASSHQGKARLLQVLSVRLITLYFKAIWFVDRYLLGTEPIQIKVNKTSIEVKGKTTSLEIQCDGKADKDGE